MCLVKLPSSKDGKLQSLQCKIFPTMRQDVAHKCHSSHVHDFFRCGFSTGTLYWISSHMWQSDSFFLWYYLKCLLKTISSQKTLPQSWQVVFSLMFIVHAPQVCDVLKNFHFWCRIEHFYFLGGMLPQLSNFGSILNTVFFRSWIGVEGDGVGKNFRNHHEEGRARASSSFLVRCHSLTRLVAKLAMSERPTWRWGCPTVCGLPIRAMIFGVALA